MSIVLVETVKVAIGASFMDVAVAAGNTASRWKSFINFGPGPQTGVEPKSNIHLILNKLKYIRLKGILGLFTTIGFKLKKHLTME